MSMMLDKRLRSPDESGPECEAREGRRQVSFLQVRRFAGAMLLLACAAVWFLLLRPPVLGGSASFIGVHGVSMTPTLHNGDLAIVEKQAHYGVGDIVAYRIPEGDPGAGQNVIHRIVGGSGSTGFVTKGDHNSYTDHFWHPKAAAVIGKVWFHIPEGAAWLAQLHHPITLAIVVSVASFLVIAWPTRRRDDGGSHANQEQVGPSTESEVENEQEGCNTDSAPVLQRC